MKKLLFILLISTSIAYAASYDCSKEAHKVIVKLAKKKLTTVYINYTPDNAVKAEACKKSLIEENAELTVNLNPVEGKKVYKYSKSVSTNWFGSFFNKIKP